MVYKRYIYRLEETSVFCVPVDPLYLKSLTVLTANKTRIGRVSRGGIRKPSKNHPTSKINEKKDEARKNIQKNYIGLGD